MHRNNGCALQKAHSDIFHTTFTRQSHIQTHLNNIWQLIVLMWKKIIGTHLEMFRKPTSNTPQDNRPAPSVIIPIFHELGGEALKQNNVVVTYDVITSDQWVCLSIYIYTQYTYMYVHLGCNLWDTVAFLWSPTRLPILTFDPWLHHGIFLHTTAARLLSINSSVN